ncbi:MAG: insulinase family protein [Oscillospiraceae bacterium]|nr:insulinase family protein [Oscillospiraceae bacterium]
MKLKKILAAITAFSMCAVNIGVEAAAAGTASVEPSQAASSAPAEQTKEVFGAIPEVGDVVYGFECKEKREFAAIGATLCLFEHQKTGAQLMYVANDDTNRAFQLTFKTRAIDNTGMPHIFEHSTLSGSEKYPSTSLWFNASYQTYNTFMNAYTTDIMTSYPIASLSEAQLLKYADFYTDACYHPNIMKDKSIFDTEAWRYRMTSLDAPIELEGTVYSEMMGATTLESEALRNSKIATFPGSVVGNDYGGDPDDIPTLTWAALKDYHNKFYHPSNSVAYLYGKFSDYTKFLKLLDNEYSKYEKEEFVFEDSGYTPIEKSFMKKVAYPVEEGSSTSDKSSVVYTVLCPQLNGDIEGELAADFLTSLLGTESSPLVRNFKAVFPNGSISCGIDTTAPDACIMFYGTNLNEDDGKTFKKVVDESLAQIAKDGFSDELIDTAAASVNIQNKLLSEGGDPVDTVLFSLSYYQALSDQPFAFVDSYEAAAYIKDYNDAGVFTSLIENLLTDPELFTVVTTYPLPGLKEKKDAALAEKLAKKKDSMTDEQKQALVDKTNNRDMEDDSSKYIKQLKAVTVKDLPEEIREYEYSDVKGEDGIRRINVKADVDGVGEVGLYFPIEGLPQDYLHWMNLYTTLTGQLGTNKHTSDEILSLSGRYLYAYGDGIAVAGNSDKYTPYLSASWIAMDDDLDEGYALVEEMLFHTDLTDVDMIAAAVSSEKTSLRGLITSAPYLVQLYRGLAIDDEMYRYENYVNYLDYYQFLEQTEELLKTDPDAALAKLRAVRNYINNSYGAIASFAGDEESISINASIADEFFSDMPHKKYPKASYDLPVPAKSEALVVDSSVQYNAVIASANAIGGKDLTVDYAVAASLVTDQFLLPELRDKNGAYGIYHSLNKNNGLYLISYRDPKLVETFQTYASLPELIKNGKYTQDVIDGYIMNTYSTLALNPGELSGAESLVANLISGYPTDINLQYMKQLKKATPQTVKDAVKYYEAALANGYVSTSGGAGIIGQNAGLYEVILNPFGSVDNSGVEFSDVTEDGKYSYEAVRYMFENKLMAPVSEDTFGVDEDATTGDVLVAIYAAAFGSAEDPETVRDALAAYGIIPADTDVTAPLTGDTLASLISLMAGQTLSPSDLGVKGDETLTRGALAELLYANFFAAQG